MAPATAAIEPFGTTPLPTSSSGSPVEVFFDIDRVLDIAQQPQTQQIATFEATPTDDCIYGAVLLDVNQHFVVYAVKNGLIRVLHRHSTLRTLLRQHKGQRVTDIRFFQDGDVMASVSSSNDTGTPSSSVIIWRVFERSPEILSEILLEIHTTKFTIRRVVWHPFNPNQFWMIHTNERHQTVATLVETTRISTMTHELADHAVCQLHDDFVVMAGAVQLKAPGSSTGNMTDLCWSDRETRYVLTTFDSGDIVLWDLKKLHPNEENATVTPEVICHIHEDVTALSRCLFLPHENGVFQNGSDGNNDSDTAWTSCFVTASDNNRVLTLWSAFSGSSKSSNSSKPSKLQVVSLENPSTSYVIDVCFGPAPADASPPSCFLVMADRTQGKIVAFHLRSVWNQPDGKSGKKNKRALLVGCDYAVPFQTKFPTYSWRVVGLPTTDISEEELNEQGGLIFDMKLYAYQSTLVQSLTLTSYMCLPPENSWMDPTEGVRVNRLLQVQSAHVSDVGSDEVVYDEDYDLGDDDDLGDDVDAPEPSALPPPDGVETAPTTAAPVSSNPFANWLGAIASKASGAPPPAPPPPPVMQPAPSAPPASDLPPPPPMEEPATDAKDTPAEPQTFLSPMDILQGSKEEVVPDPVPSKPNRRTDSGKKGRKKSPKRGGSGQGKVAILRRDEEMAAAPLSLQTTDLGSEVRKAVREEISSSVLPHLEKTIQNSLNISVVQPLQSSIGKLERQGIKIDSGAIASSVSDSVDEPLKEAFADSMKSVFVPALESITSQVLAQVSDHLQEGLAASVGGPSKDLEAISTQLSTMTALVAKLTAEVQSLRATVAAQEGQAQALSSPGTNFEAVQSEILALLQEEKYDAAFNKAISAKSTELTVFCCQNSDINRVLGGTTTNLSQTILLCLMQQLGTVLSTPKGTDLLLVLEWLQEIALSLDPSDARIQAHVPPVVQQLVNSINNLMAQGDPDLRRPLQKVLQVVRGLPMK